MFQLDGKKTCVGRPAFDPTPEGAAKRAREYIERKQQQQKANVELVLQSIEEREAAHRAKQEREIVEKKLKEERKTELYKKPSQTDKARRAFCALACRWKKLHGEELAVGSGRVKEIDKDLPFNSLTFIDNYLRRLKIKENHDPTRGEPPVRTMLNVNIREMGNDGSSSSSYDYRLNREEVEDVCKCDDRISAPSKPQSVSLSRGKIVDLVEEHGPNLSSKERVELVNELLSRPGLSRDDIVSQMLRPSSTERPRTEPFHVA